MAIKRTPAVRFIAELLFPPKEPQRGIKSGESGEKAVKSDTVRFTPRRNVR